jgi:hypothetical protein
MTNEEFSNGMDTLLNSYGSAAGFGDQASVSELVLDEYEKSLFLTEAQESLVQALYAGEAIGNESYEETERLRRYLSTLNMEDNIEPMTPNNTGIDGDVKFFKLPEDLWFITYEAVILYEGKCPGHNTLNVLPVTQDEYHRVKKNPFRGTNDRRALRLDLADGVVEIVSDYPIEYYYVRYLKNTTPIILEDLPDDLTIKGESKATECTLHQALHERILERAVETALQSKGYNIKNENR